MSPPDGLVCPACGEENPGRARFCLSCGASLALIPQAREVRKTVTTLFCDVVESTALGEHADPELVRRVMSRFYDEMRAVIEHHGGTVEKFAGDEVMAVFGVPAVHEDDAVRAVRAAAEMRSRLRVLNEELEASFGVRLVTRMGIDTGQVVAGDPSSGQTFVTGESVNLAKRLEQAAKPGEILIGTATYPLVKDAVEVGPAERVSVKGKAEPVAPRRLDAVDAAAPGLARRFDAPLVGRDDELSSLADAFERTIREDSSHLVTLLGSAGIGKSRLARELLAAAGERATTLTGRCLPYGEGITFWPLGQIVREAGGDRVLRDALAGDDDAELIAERVRGAVGLSQSPGDAQETFWAVRRFFEALARRQPLIVCFEDIHWAEPTLLDLIEYLVTCTHDVPMLLLCLARPDLIETRPTWAAATAHTTLISLEHLTSGDTEALLEGLQGEADLSAETRARIMEAAGGNPLFVEQMVAMVASDGESSGELAVPPSIQALLGERLDRLEPGERSMIERACVIGKEFRRDALMEIASPELRASAGSLLMSLVRKGMLSPDISSGADESFRFRHVLIRDAAYDGISKELRADLHERLADWLEGTTGDQTVELEEITGYHLEQAHRYRTELGSTSAEVADLARRAAARLSSAGRRALARGDMPAAASLLLRATILLAADDRARLELAPDLGAALADIGESVQAEAVLERAIADATALGSQTLAARAQIVRSAIRMHTRPEGASEDVARVAAEAIEVFTGGNDEVGLAQAWRHLSRVHLMSSRWGAQTEALERALVHARRAGDRREEAMILGSLALSLYWGPTPVAEAIARCEQMLKETGGDRTVEARVTVSIAGLEAMRGRFDLARTLYARSKTILTDLGLRPLLAAHTLALASVESLAGDPGAAEEELREGVDVLEELGLASSFATLASVLATTCHARGRLEEAELLVERARLVAPADDVASQVLWRAAHAKVLAARRELVAAELAARESVALAGETDALNLHADSLVGLADVLQLAGEESAAEDALSEAVRLYTLKGNEVAAGRAEALLQHARA